MPTSDFTISDVLAWARTKPADELFRYSDIDNCACAQFVRSVGAPLHGELRSRLERKLGMLILDCEYIDGGRRFGEFAERIEALLPAEPLTDTWTKANAYLTDIKALDREVA